MTGPQIIRLVITIPNSTNDLYVRGRDGKVVMAREYQDWKRAAGMQIMSQRPKLACRSLPAAPYAVRLLVPINDRGDIDNRDKALLDLLHEMQITPDDKLLWDFRVLRVGYVTKKSVQVLVRSLSEPELAAARADHAAAEADQAAAYVALMDGGSACQKS